MLVLDVPGVQWLKVKSRKLRVDNVPNLKKHKLDDCVEKLEVFEGR